MSHQSYYPVKLMDKTQTFIDKNGFVPLAFHLGLRDTSGIKKWFRERHIPKLRAAQLEKFLKGKKLNKVQE